MGNAIQPIIVATINLNKKLATDQELINLLRNRQPKGTPANSNPVKTILNKSGSWFEILNITVITTATRDNKTSLTNLNIAYDIMTTLPFYYLTLSMGKSEPIVSLNCTRAFFTFLSAEKNHK